MSQIVTCHRFDEGSKGHLSTLRMQHGLRHHLWRYRAEQHQIPLAYAGKGHHGRLWIVAGIVGRPDLLVERLDDVMVLRQRLAKTESENQLAIRQVAQNFVRAPFSGSRRFFYPRRAESYGKLFEMPGSGGHYFERVATAQVSCVWIHPITITATGSSSQNNRTWVTKERKRKCGKAVTRRGRKRNHQVEV
jgi:hypothetical protein